ncbi:hypothetical protein HK102_011253 [Quaeritorhiza haematococci]|nr:hypothetical protein HK102_011253 [Quaeritorhiza haematococci]
MAAPRLQRRVAEAPDDRLKVILKKIFDKVPELPSTIKKGNKALVPDVLVLARKKLPEGQLISAGGSSTDGQVFQNMAPEKLPALPDRTEYREFRLFNPDLPKDLPKNIKLDAADLQKISENYRLLISADGDIYVSPDHYASYFQLDRTQNKWIEHKTLAKAAKGNDLTLPGLPDPKDPQFKAKLSEAKVAYRKVIDNMDQIASKNRAQFPDLVKLPFGQDVALGVSSKGLPDGTLIPEDELKKIRDLPDDAQFGNPLPGEVAENKFAGERTFRTRELPNKNKLHLSSTNELVLETPDGGLRVWNRKEKKWNDPTNFITEDGFKSAASVGDPCGTGDIRPLHLRRRQIGAFCGRKPAPKSVDVVDAPNNADGPDGPKPGDADGTSSPRPDDPNAPKPDSPNAPAPDTPNTPTPDTPTAPKPDAPNPPAPDAPTLPKPDIEVRPPATPDAPSVPAPDVPAPALDVPTPGLPTSPDLPKGPGCLVPGQPGPCRSLSSIVPDSAALPGVEAKSLSAVTSNWAKVMDNLGTALTVVAIPIIIYDIVNTCQTKSTQDCVLAVTSLVLGAAAEAACTVVGGPGLGFVCGFAVGFIVSAGPIFVENLKQTFNRSWNEILKEAAAGNWGEVAKESVAMLFNLQVTFLDTVRNLLGEQVGEITQLAKSLGDQAVSGTQTAVDATVGAIEGVAGKPAAEVAGVVGQAAVGATQEAVNNIVQPLQTVQGLITDPVGTVTNKANEVKQGVVDAANAVGQFGQDLVNNPGEAIHGAAASAAEHAVGGVFGESAGNFAETLVKDPGQAFNDIGQGVVETANTVGEAFSNAGSTIAGCPALFTIEYIDSGRRVQLTKDDRLAILFDLYGIEEYFIVADNQERHSSSLGAVDKSPEQSNLGFFDPNWVCRHGKQEHDFFISYRVKTDGANAEKLALELMADDQHPHAYLDRRCLVAGKPFQEGFLNGLKRSRVIVLLISSGALKDVRDAHNYADNMLLEWEYALEDLKTSSMTKVIIPLLIATENDDASFRKFADFDTTVYADEFPTHPQSTHKNTVREVMRKIFETQGIHYIPQDDENRSRYVVASVTRSQPGMEKDLRCKIGCSYFRLSCFLPSVRARLLCELAKVRSENPPSKPTSSPSEHLHPSRPFNFTVTEDDLLRQWLKPLDEEMLREREDASKRHLRGTRTWLLKQILEWCQGEREDRLMWLQGQAGMGKTVMAGYVAEELLKRNLLGSAYFFKYNVTNRSDPSSLIRTLAYNLTKWSTSFAMQLLEIHQKSPEVIDSALSKMFVKLILEPLTSIKDSQPKPLALVIDALDECGIIGSRQEILDILASGCNQLPHFVKIILTSRPEEDIVASFQAMKTKKLEPTRDENMADIRMYSEHIFRRKWHLHNQAFEQVVTKFTESSGGVFAWVKYAEETLEQRLAAASSGETARQDIIQDLVDHALSLPGDMSELYDKSFRDDIWLDPKVIKVLHTLATLSDPLTPSGISELFEWDEDEVNTALRNIQPLLSIDPSTQIVRFFHKSVYDYLSNAAKCSIPGLLLDARKMNSELAMRCIWLMNKRLSRNLCSLPHDVLHENIPHFRDRVTTSIPLGGGLRYACLRWTGHVRECVYVTEAYRSNVSIARNLPAATSDIYKATESFLQTHIHHWFEVLSLLESFSSAVPFLLQLEDVWQASVKAVPTLSSDFPSFSTMVYDGRRFAQTFGYPVTRCAQQVYISALPLCPSGSLISKLEQSPDLIDNDNQPPHDMKILLGKDNEWSPCLMTLFGHQGWVKAVAVTPDGRYVVTGAADGSAKIWDLASGKEVRELRGHQGPLRAVTVTPDGRNIVTGSEDCRVKVWDFVSGKEVRELYGHQLRVNTLAVTSDGRNVVTGSSDCTAKVWDFASGKELRELRGHQASIKAVAVTPDGSHVVTGSDDGIAMVWDLASGKEVGKLYAQHQGSIEAAAVIPHKGYVVTGSHDNIARLWDVASGKEVREFRGHQLHVNAVSVTPGGRYVVTGSSDNTTKLWDLASGNEVLELRGHQDGVSAVTVTADGRYLVTGSYDCTAKVWDLTSRKAERDPQRHRLWVNTVNVTPDGRYVVTGSKDGTAKVWDLASGKEVRELRGHQDGVTTVSFTQDGRHVVTGSEDGTARVWDFTTGEMVWELRGHVDSVNAVAVTHDGRVVAGSDDCTINVWDVASGQKVRELCGHQNSVNAVAVTPDGRHLVTGSDDRTVMVWDLESGKKVRELHGHQDSVNAVIIIPDGRHVVTVSKDGAVKVWDLAFGNEVRELKFSGQLLFPQSPGTGITISKDGWIRPFCSHKIAGWIPFARGVGCVASNGRIVLASQNDLVYIKLGLDGKKKGEQSWHKRAIGVWTQRKEEEDVIISGKHKEGGEDMRCNIS